MSIWAQGNIKAIDVHLHAATDEYLKYLEDNNALREGNMHSNDAIPVKTNMCEKLPMEKDGIVRLSKIQVNPDYLEEYMKYATEVGTVSLETERGVLTMYAVADKDNPCNITILETYASQQAYKSHIASEHFQKYKQATLHMVDSLCLDDVIPLNPNNIIRNYIQK